MTSERGPGSEHKCAPYSISARGVGPAASWMLQLEPATRLAQQDQALQKATQLSKTWNVPSNSGTARRVKFTPQSSLRPDARVNQTSTVNLSGCVQDQTWRSPGVAGGWRTV
ncbi:hypothetical protein RRG08_023310 [Elysia crispata]|uniref:Uncharacterized protein n=1 Tax=Elysia crispata TaxID=231223 RepID=A0AAE1BE84_9GAST|nr:hypothetical protein RRG08_023310 [Elysia crispata]